MSQQIDPSKMRGALRAAVKEALAHGWTAKRGSGNGWKLRSPGGTKWMHVSPSTNIADDQAKKLRTLIAEAALTEPGEQQDKTREMLNDPDEPNATVVCTECEKEFLTWDGYAAHQYACMVRYTARMAAVEDVVAGDAQVEAERPSEGRTEAPDSVEGEAHRLPRSSRMSDKEEVMTDSGGTSRKGYSWSVVKPGLARAIYSAMMQRSRHKGEATSTYANVIASIIEESGIEFGEAPVLSEAQRKLDTIVSILGIDTDALEGYEILKQDNEKLQRNLDALKELIAGI